MKLNLEAKGRDQELIKKYLEENASDILVQKINNGTPFEKSGKSLINKKTLDGFMNYAYSEAKKLVEKGANCACVEDRVVYGWAIHYFEEDSIEGTLYNEDGTKFKYESKVEVKKNKEDIEKAQKVLSEINKETKSAKPQEQKSKEQKLEQNTPQQLSIFDMLGGEV